MRPASTVRIGVRSKDGMFRFELRETDTLFTLKQQIEEKTGVPTSAQRLSKDQKSESNDFSNDQLSLSKCNIRQGDVLYLAYSRDVVSKQDIELEKRAEQKRQIRENEDIQHLDLAGRKHQWTLQEYLDLKEKFTIRIKHQEETVCTALNLDSTAANQFQLFLREMAFQTQRMGYLYGFVMDDGSVAADVIYEPPQEGSPEGFIELNDPIRDRVDVLAELLGMRKVGWVFSHAPGRDYTMSGAEILKAAELQSKHGKYCCTVTVTTNNEGQIMFESYQVSDQCVKLFEEDLLLADDSNPKVLKTKKPVVVDKKEMNEVDTALFITTVAIKDRQGTFLGGFPVSNRPSSDHRPSMAACKAALQSRSKLPFIKRVADFHMLLFLTNYLSINNDMPLLCEAIKSQNSELASGLEVLVKHYAGIQY